MPHTNHVRDRFVLPFVALLLVGSVSWAADTPVTRSVRPTVVFAGRDARATVRTPRDARNREVRADRGHQAQTQCFAVLGFDDSADTFRAPPRRSAPAEPAAIRAGC